MRRILILGGYGTFGGRIARLLAKQKRWTVIVAGRSKQKADAFARSLGDPQVSTAAIDRDKLNAATLRDLDLWLVIDASGPFQGAAPLTYPVVQAAIEAGVNYIDIADAV